MLTHLENITFRGFKSGRGGGHLISYPVDSSSSLSSSPAILLVCKPWSWAAYHGNGVPSPFFPGILSRNGSGFEKSHAWKEWKRNPPLETYGFYANPFPTESTLRIMAPGVPERVAFGVHGFLSKPRLPRAAAPCQRPSAAPAAPGPRGTAPRRR